VFWIFLLATILLTEVTHIVLALYPCVGDDSFAVSYI